MRFPARQRCILKVFNKKTGSVELNVHTTFSPSSILSTISTNSFFLVHINYRNNTYRRRYYTCTVYQWLHVYVYIPVGSWICISTMWILLLPSAQPHTYKKRTKGNRLRLHLVYIYLFPCIYYRKISGKKEFISAIQNYNCSNPICSQLLI